MFLSAKNKLKDNSGKLSRLTVIIAVICIAVVIAIVVYPLIKKSIREMRANECYLSLSSASRRISIDANLDGSNRTAEQIKEFVTKAMFGWDDLCPDGGTVYVVPNVYKEPPFYLYCGLHGTDAKLNAQLNAANCLDQVREAVKNAREKGEAVPGEIEVTFNSQKYTVVLVREDPKLRRGTYYYTELDGIVMYFAVAGDSDFGSSFKQNDNEVSFFAFADENYSAVWNYMQGWTGTAFD